MITTLNDVEVYLRAAIARVSSLPTRGMTIERTQQLADAVGNPEQRLRVVHVAGTSGKTSTSYYISALLLQARQKVGLTVSPHIATIAERVILNGEPLDETTFVHHFNEYISMVEASGVKPTYFELMMVFALWVFEREGVDFAVVETGFGGLHDSSNICRRSDKMCVITDIGFDHMHILGNTLELIAEQKAGIIAPQNHVVMYEQNREIMEQVERATHKQEARLHIVDNPHNEESFMQRNFNLAQKAYELLAERDNVPVLNKSQRIAAFHAKVPGRLEVIELNGTHFVLDGAHNEQKMSTLFATLQTIGWDSSDNAVVFAMKTDKQLHDVCDIIARHSTRVIATVFAHGQDLPSIPIPLTEIVEAFHGKTRVDTAETMHKALGFFRNGIYERIIVTGSLYAVAEARAILLQWGGRVQ